MDKKYLGAIFLVLFVIAESLDIILLKYVFLQGAQPYQFVYQSLFLAGIFVTIYLFFSRKKDLKFSRRDIPAIVTIGILANGLGDLFWLIGLKLSTASTFGFLNKLSVVFVMVFALIILGEKFSKKKGFFLLLILFGGYLISTNGETFRIQLSDIFIIAGVASFALSHVISKKINTRNSPQYIAISRFFCGSLVLFFASFLLFENVFVFNYWPYVIIDGILMFSFVLFFYKSMELKSASFVASFSSIVPVLVATIAFFIFGEVMTYIQIIGGVIILISVSLLPWINI